MICLHEGGDRSHCTVRTEKEGILLGNTKDLNGLMELKAFIKKVMQVVMLNEGKVGVLFINIDLTKHQNFHLIYCSTWPSFICSFDVFSFHLKKCPTTLISAGSAPLLFICLRQDFSPCLEKTLYLLFNSVVLAEFTNPKLILRYP